MAGWVTWLFVPHPPWLRSCILLHWVRSWILRRRSLQPELRLLLVLHLMEAPFCPTFYRGAWGVLCDCHSLLLGLKVFAGRLMTFKTETQRKPLGLFQRLPKGVSKTHLLPFTGSKPYQEMSSELSTVVWENLSIELALNTDLWSVGGCLKHTHPPPPPRAHLRRRLQLACPTRCSGMCWSSFRGKRTLWRALLLVGQLWLWSVNSPHARPLLSNHKLKNLW